MVLKTVRTTFTPPRPPAPGRARRTPAAAASPNAAPRHPALPSTRPPPAPTGRGSPAPAPSRNRRDTPTARHTRSCPTARSRTHSASAPPSAYPTRRCSIATTSRCTSSTGKFRSGPKDYSLLCVALCAGCDERVGLYEIDCMPDAHALPSLSGGAAREPWPVHAQAEDGLHGSWQLAA